MASLTEEAETLKAILSEELASAELVLEEFQNSYSLLGEEQETALLFLLRVLYDLRSQYKICIDRVLPNAKSQLSTEADLEDAKKLKALAEAFEEHRLATIRTGDQRFFLDPTVQSLVAECQELNKQVGWADLPKHVEDARRKALEREQFSPQSTLTASVESDRPSLRESHVADPEMSVPAQKHLDSLSESADPDDRTLYRDFSADLPLYDESDGMSPDDVKQGILNDCSVMATLASLAQVNPDALKERITDNGDGTFDVTLSIRKDPDSRERTEEVVRVDLDFVANDSGGTAYAGLGDGEAWVAVLEKAYATVMGGYDNIEWGFSGETLEVFTAKTSVFKHSHHLAPEEILAVCAHCLAEGIPMVLDSNAPSPSASGTDESTGAGAGILGRADLGDGRFIQGPHGYSLVKVVNDQIFIRNPLGAQGELPAVFPVSAQEIKMHFAGINYLE